MRRRRTARRPFDAPRRESAAVAMVIVVGSALALSASLGSPEANPTAPTAGSTPSTTLAGDAPGASTSELRPLTSTSSPSSELSAVTAVVTRVIDGDTVVLGDGRRVRLAQVDAPETNQCFGSESTAALRELVDRKEVTLRRPAGAPAKDRYGRTLAELVVDGVSADEALIRNGAAEWYEQFGHEDLDLAARLQAAEAEASAAGLGLWTACRAGGVTPTTTAPTPPPLVDTANRCHPAYPDDCIPPGPPDLNCGSAEIRRRIRVDHADRDTHGFDADRDGWGCESYG